MSISPDVALNTLKAAHCAAKDASALIDMGLEFRDARAIEEGAEILTGVVSDTAYILENIEPKILIGNASRKGMRPALPEERIEILQEAVAIDEIAMENLLKARMDIQVEQEKLLVAQFYRLLNALRARVESTKRILQKNWPGFWGPEHDVLFGKYLRKPK